MKRDFCKNSDYLYTKNLAQEVKSPLLISPQHLKWRAEKQVDEIQARDFQTYYKDFPVKICGRDKAGYLEF
ncbi:unnamed protein product [Allacma fusca]|uniref:Uncharacterized protein n=1 Tax=Allacma fusca TaxID=39272 RepID=A0A8J2KXA5_9HEXA|nr:unnamed protein product [Allacma fusca]